MGSNLYYRPEWTCGRYDAQHRVAIFYNLIEGMSYFFEDDSAEIIGYILSHPRNASFSLADAATSTDTDTECLADFFGELMGVGLLTDSPITSLGLADYRHRVAEFKKNNAQTSERGVQEKLPFEVSNAEREYMNRAGGVTSVMLELTYRCSEKCIHCYNIGATRNDEEQSGRGKLEELSLDDYKRVIDELYDLGLVKVCVTGGDPFSNAYAWQILQYLYSKDIAFDVFTNAQVLAGKEQQLANLYPRAVGVSLYSGIADVHDSITRVKGSWDKSMSVLSMLSDLSVPLNIKCCIMRPNLKSYRSIIEIAKGFGAIPQFEINITDSIEGDKCASMYLRLRPEEMKVVLRDNNIPLYVGPEAPNYGSVERDPSQCVCGAGDGSLCLTPDGTLIPCCSYHLDFGNVTELSVSDILCDNPALETCNSLTYAKFDECGKYEYCPYCNLCPGNNFTEHGDASKASENNCYTAKLRYEVAEMLRNGTDPLNGMSIDERLSEFPDYSPQSLKREYKHENATR